MKEILVDFLIGIIGGSCVVIFFEVGYLIFKAAYVKEPDNDK